MKNRTTTILLSLSLTGVFAGLVAVDLGCSSGPGGLSGTRVDPAIDGGAGDAGTMDASLGGDGGGFDAALDAVLSDGLFADGSVDGGTSPCTFDTRSLSEFQGKVYEGITARGRYWIYDGETLVSSGDLTNVARYAAAGGPCAGKAAGTCHFDNIAYSSPLQGAPVIQTIVAYGKYWRFDGETPVAPIGGALLESVTRYAASICTGKPAGACHFDTGVFTDFGGLPYESFSDGNRYWIFQGDTFVQGAALDSVARYAAGPCAGHLGSCAFETKIDALFGGKLYETIDAYGRYWIFDGDTLVQTNTHASVARYAAAGGACAP